MGVLRIPRLQAGRIGMVAAIFGSMLELHAPGSGQSIMHKEAK